MLIDDDYEYVDNFAWYLQRKGYKVLKSGTGTFGVELAQKERPHIILCDLLMLDINGDEVLKRVKASNPKTIFIIVSAYVDENTKAKLQKLGAHSFIEKIVKFKPTEEYIKSVLEKEGAIKES